jgi:outer membrane protein
MLHALIVLGAAQSVLTLATAEANTRQNLPAIHVAVAQTAAQKAVRDQVFSGYMPQLSASIQYFPLQTGTAGQAVASGAKLPANTALTEVLAGQTATFGVTANQLIYDFNQTIDKIKAADQSVVVQQRNESVVWNNVLLTMRSAYFIAQEDKALIQVAQETLDDDQKHVDEMSAFVKAGTHPPIDLAQAQQQRAAAQYQLISAQGAYEQAKANLQLAMGLNAPPDYDVTTDLFPAVPGEESTTDALLPEALAARPEIKFVQDQIDAQRLTIAADKAGWLPSISATANGSGSWTDFAGGSLLVPRASAGFTFAWPFYLGGFTQAVTRQAEANIVQFQAQLDAQTQQVRNDVDVARVAVTTGKGQVDSSQEALNYAQEQLKLANGQYAAGVAIALAVFDAEVAVTTSGGTLAQSVAALAIARAQLLRALGREKY